MIDFRYHLISIVAVLLALAIGIFAGSGFLGGPLLRDLNNRIEDVEERNNELRSKNLDLHEELDQADQFTKAVEPALIRDVLSGDRVVIIEFEGTDSGTVDDLRQEAERAGAVVASRITFTNKLAAEQETDRDQLALIVGSTSARPAEVRRDAADAIGGAAAAAGAFAGGEPRGAAAAVQRFHNLVDQLDRAGFMTVDQFDGEEPVPPGTSFVIVGGSADPAPFGVGAFTSELSLALAVNGVIVAEPSTSIWGLATAIRDDPKTADEIATCDGADSVSGQIATVLGLAAAKRGEPGHYGTGPGATDLVPSPAPVG